MSDGFTHDFDKAITEVFGLPIYWYGAAYTLGFLGVLVWFAFRRSRLGWPMAHVLDVSIFLAVGVLLGGRIFDILVYEFGDIGTGGSADVPEGSAADEDAPAEETGE